ncbi:hypothetical protein AL922_24025 [Salmonella enterica subsp. enterica serovar Senftenberg]|nr:hypothetical protein [Salmonella enterica]ECV9768453.1 hypothetical protein [Salmonella enterica subsp. enterica serovar Senftenberg]
MHKFSAFYRPSDQDTTRHFNAPSIESNLLYLVYSSHCFSGIAFTARFFLIIPPHLVLPSCPLSKLT